MKTTTLLFTLGLLAGCSSPMDEPGAAMPDAADSPAVAASAETETASTVTNIATASGVVEAVDPAAKTVTIAHGPVAALQWPAMTMTFQAPNVDLSSIQQGDQVSFEFTSIRMDGTITAIARQQR